ncbi:MAG TPA: histidinol-phosphate transaminase [Bacteroidales bacterium]|nr:histidinol-phosphate transaminase [Bacteroidales bacterium]
MTDIDRLVRENVRRLIPYSCARDEFKGKEGIFLDANENPYGKLNRYPDPYQKELKARISEIKAIPEENIFLGNGSDEIIDLCFRIFCNPGKDRALTFHPTYGMYEVSASINDVELIRVPLTDDFRIDMERTLPFLEDESLKLIFICSPNNPTGNSMDTEAVHAIVENFRGIVVIDEAYIDFSDQPSFKTLVPVRQNLIVMQTFSKAMGLAAARVGMAFAQTGIIEYFNKMKPPYNISDINQKAAIRSLRDVDAAKRRIARIVAERKRLEKTLAMTGFVEKVFPSDSNFILVKVRDADLVYSRLLESGIIVRNRNKIVDGCIRITTGTPTENNRLISALKKINS